MPKIILCQLLQELECLEGQKERQNSTRKFGVIFRLVSGGTTVFVAGKRRVKIAEIARPA